jgi:hypothetical protein
MDERMKFEIEKRVVKPKDPEADKRFHKEVSYHVCKEHAIHIMSLMPTIATCPYCDGTEEYIPQRFHGIDEDDCKSKIITLHPEGNHVTTP